ncbi:hypothetical protein MMC29_006224, partial [Sticta canariensis]|nr:hypothetical protein [Sticta canariensis]
GVRDQHCLPGWNCYNKVLDSSLLSPSIRGEPALQQLFLGSGDFILAYTIAAIFVVIFQCEPVHGFWDVQIKAKCIDFSVPATFGASFNVVTDFLTLTLPMPLIWKLQMSGRRKLQMAGIFLLGGL